MGKKTKPNDTEAEHQREDVVAGGSSAKKKASTPLSYKVKIWFLILTLALMGIAFGGWAVLGNKKTVKPEAPTQFLTKEQLGEKVKRTTGRQLRDIQRGEITKGTFKNFEAAEVTGVALYKNGDYKQAQQSFSSAKQHASQEDLTEEFYLQYINSAINSGDIVLAKALAGELKDKIKADASMGKYNQRDKIEQIEMYEKQWGQL